VNIMGKKPPRTRPAKKRTTPAPRPRSAKPVKNKPTLPRPKHKAKSAVLDRPSFNLATDVYSVQKARQHAAMLAGTTARQSPSGKVVILATMAAPEPGNAGTRPQGRQQPARGPISKTRKLTSY